MTLINLEDQFPYIWLCRWYPVDCKITSLLCWGVHEWYIPNNLFSQSSSAGLAIHDDSMCVDMLLLQGINQVIEVSVNVVTCPNFIEDVRSVGWHTNTSTICHLQTSDNLLTDTPSSSGCTSRNQGSNFCKARRWLKILEKKRYDYDRNDNDSVRDTTY